MLLFCPLGLFPRVLSPCQGLLLDPVHEGEERENFGQEVLLGLGVSIGAWRWGCPRGQC